MSDGFNAMVRRLMNEQSMTFEQAVRELSRRSHVVRRAKKLSAQRKHLLSPHAREKPFDGVESPQDNG